MAGNFSMGGLIDLNRLASDASWRQVIRRAEQARSEVEASGRRSHELDMDERKSLRETCQKFEAIFVGYMLKQMRQTVPESSLFPETPAEKIYRSMLDDEVAQAACKTGGIGLADMIFNDLLNNNTREEQSDRGEKESEIKMGEESAKVSGLTHR
ncbi:MAG TPA: rod-binding protein [bacterium]|nr:rod-binding protein [bacterium]